MENKRLVVDVDEVMDEALVQATKERMRQKLAQARNKGRGGWWNPEVCTTEELRESMMAHMAKGDLIDVINLAAMVIVRERMESGGSHV